MADEHLYEDAFKYIEEKLLVLFGYTEKANPDAYQKFHNSFNTNEIKKEIQPLFFQSKKMLLIGTNKEQVVINPKDAGRKKSILILKTNKEEGLVPDMTKNFLFIELSKKTLNEMYILCNDIFFPLLTQNVQQPDTSELISKELMEKFHNFLSHFYVALGHTEGKTRLPEPSDEIFRNPNINDNEKTQICEGAIVMWIDLIRYILKQEPEHDFRNGGNPLPVSEINFWGQKSTDLNSILEQIKKKKIAEILKFLEKQKSTYHDMFTQIQKDVEKAAKETDHNYKYLKCLKDSFEFLEGTSQKAAQAEFTDIVDEFVPIFHIIRKIWTENSYYAKPERLIVLIRKLCNVIIERGIEFVGQNPFNKIIDDPDKEIQVLDITRQIIQKFMDAYFQFKDNDSNSWQITRNVIFFRLDAFNDRIGDILNIAKSYSEFSKMRTKVIGGIKGEALGQTLIDIFNECTKEIKDFISEEYNPLDINDDTFNTKYVNFKDSLKELERKISAVLTQTFDENDTILGKFKVLDNFDSILERPYIVVELEKKYNILLELFKEELRVVHNLFLVGKKQIESKDEKNPLNKNMPPIAAMLNWTDSLKSRIKEPLEKFKLCGKRITEKEEFKEIESSYTSIYNMIDEYGTGSKKGWDQRAENDSKEKQKDFILTKKPTGGHLLLNVNFDPGLLQLLKEVKYLKILNMNIPNEADEAFQKNAIFRKQISNLENIKAQYNNIILQLNEVEKPMVQNKLNKVESQLEPGLNKITWEQSAEIDKFTKGCHKIISELADTVTKLKTFVGKIDAIFKDWLKPENMLFQKPSTINEADAVSTRFIAYYDQERSKMANKVKDISNLSEVQTALKSAVSNLSSFKETEEWKNYQHYINKLVLDGSKELIFQNLLHLSNCLDPSLPPFCSVKLLLEDRNIVFRPAFKDGEDGKTIKSMILEWINSFLNLSTLFRIRVDMGMGDYMIEVMEDFRIQEIVYKLYNEVNELSKESDSKMNSFGDFKMLWEKDFEESFQQFLKENTVIPQPTPEQLERQERIDKIFNENNPNPITKNIIEYTPTKEVFDDKINEYKDKLKRVQNMPQTIKVRWIEVDFTEFKSELTKIIETWIEKYKLFLKKNSSVKLENITTFMDRVENGIINKPKDTSNEEDKKKFFGLLENIRDMDLLYPKIVELIPSIKGELEILKKHTKSENEDDPYNIEEKDTDSEEQRLIHQTEDVEKNIVELKKKLKMQMKIYLN